AVDSDRPDGRADILVARSAVMRLGGRQYQPQHPLLPGLRLADCRVHRLMPSDRALSTAGLNEADRALAEANGRRIIVLGGSHSAYSVAGALLGFPAPPPLPPPPL